MNAFQRSLAALRHLVSCFRSGQSSRRGIRPAKILVEVLEPRCVPATLTVNSVDDNTTSDNFLTLREAVAVANSDSTAGLTPAEQAQISGVLGDDIIVFDAALFGGGPRLLLMNAAGFDITSNITVTGPGASLLTIFAGTGSVNHFLVQAAGVLTVESVTMTGGTFGNGASIFNDGNLTVRNATIEGNTGSNGAIYNTATAVIEDSILRNNMAFNEGGAIFNLGGTLTVMDSTISGNTADDGGGISMANFGNVTILNSTITGNTAITNASPEGGGIFNDNGTLTIRHSTFSQNFAEKGSAVFNESGRVNINNSLITANLAGRGAIYNEGQRLTISNTTISGNSATINGGGIYNNNATGTVSNSTITGNSANSDYPAGSGTGGGIHTTGQLTLNNTIVAGNVQGDGTDDDIAGTVIGEHNLIGDPNSAGGLINGVGDNIVGDSGSVIDINTVLDPVLKNHGGPTLIHALVEDSPAIDAGDQTLALEDVGIPLTTDQRGVGFPRVLAGEVDIGAFEGFIKGRFKRGSISIFQRPIPRFDRGGAPLLLAGPAPGAATNTILVAPPNGEGLIHSPGIVDVVSAVNSTPVTTREEQLRKVVSGFFASLADWLPVLIEEEGKGISEFSDIATARNQSPNEVL